MFVPPGYNKTGTDVGLKKILVSHGMGEVKLGSEIFTQQGCPVSTCTIIRDNPSEADLILFKDYVLPVQRKSPSQVLLRKFGWKMYFYEFLSFHGDRNSICDERIQDVINLQNATIHIFPPFKKCV